MEISGKNEQPEIEENPLLSPLSGGFLLVTSCQEDGSLSSAASPDKGTTGVNLHPHDMVACVHEQYFTGYGTAHG